MIGKTVIDAAGKRYGIIEHYQNADEMVAKSADCEQMAFTAMEIAQGEYEVVDE